MDDEIFKDKALDIYNGLNQFSPTEIDEAITWLTEELKAFTSTPF